MPSARIRDVLLAGVVPARSDAIPPPQLRRPREVGHHLRTGNLQTGAFGKVCTLKVGTMGVGHLDLPERVSAAAMEAEKEAWQDIVGGKRKVPD